MKLQFEELYEKWINKPSGLFWTDELAKKYGFESSEGLRSAFRTWRRNIKKSEEYPPNKERIVHSKGNTNAKILLFDIETSPINALVWGIWEQNISLEAILQDWHLLSWSAKWLFDDKVMSDVLTSKEAKNHDDKRIVESIWKLLDEADITVAHNGDRFDHKKLNTRFLFHDMLPVSHYRSVDTLRVAKSAFNLTSNKLDYINDLLGIPRKTETGFELWKKAYEGDSEALKTLEDYNKNDVFILEELFLRLRPYIKNFPNLNLYTDDDISVCRNCGSKNIEWSGHYYTNVNRYRGWRCNDCGSIGRSRFSDLSKEKKKSVIA